MLRECFFEIAHTYFALGMYEEAIVRYGGAANRYPADPQVLLAYLQMSNCNDRLGKSDEARSMLEQARIIHKSMQDAEFEPHLTNMNKPGWSGWIEWARQLHQAEAGEQLAEAQPGT
jgi:tetratricopeptide (TPR) repeat protein